MPSGPGGLDSNGIWQYGEADNPDGTGSGLLNLLAASVSTAVHALITKAPYTWADATARGSQTGMAAGDKGLQRDTKVVYRYNGTGWKEWESDWITWATAPTNLVVGTGGSANTTQRYKWIAGRLLFDVSYTLGTSGQSVGTNPTVNLPFAIALIAGVTGGMFAGDGIVYDLSPGAAVTNFTRALQITSTTVYIRTYNGTLTAVSATAPITWAAGDKLSCTFWADPA